MNLMFTPTTLAYALSALDHVFGGVGLYALLWLVSLRLGLFESLRAWPLLPKLVLFAGPLYLATGFILASEGARYWVLAPAMVYTILSVGGGLALRRANLDTPLSAQK